MNPVMFPWIIEIGFITFRDMTGKRDTLISGGSGLSLATPTSSVLSNKVSTGPKRPPLPSELLATFIAYGTFSVIADGGGNRPRIGALLAWGVTLATALIVMSAPAAKGGDFTRSQQPNFMGPLPTQ